MTRVTVGMVAAYSDVSLASEQSLGVIGNIGDPSAVHRSQLVPGNRTDRVERGNIGAIEHVDVDDPIRGRTPKTIGSADAPNDVVRR